MNNSIHNDGSILKKENLNEHFEDTDLLKDVDPYLLSEMHQISNLTSNVLAKENIDYFEVSARSYFTLGEIENLGITEDDYDFIVDSIVKSENGNSLEGVFVEMGKYFSKRHTKEDVTNVIRAIKDKNPQFREIGNKVLFSLELVSAKVWQEPELIEQKEKDFSISEELFADKNKYILDDFAEIEGKNISAIFEKGHNGYRVLFTTNVGLAKPFDKKLGRRGLILGDNPKDVFDEASKEFFDKYHVEINSDIEEWR